MAEVLQDILLSFCAYNYTHIRPFIEMADVSVSVFSSILLYMSVGIRAEL